MESQNIQVFVRVRPQNYREMHLGSDICVTTSPPNIVVLESKPDPKRFTFDQVLGPESTQDSVFEAIGKPTTQSALSGLNCCIFAYGQTGAGKTYTMSGKGFEEFNVSGKPDQQGLQPRVISYLYDEIQSQIDESSYDSIVYAIKCSYLEIYNEQIIDLLSDCKSQQLNIREDVKKGIYVENLTEVPTDNFSQTIAVLLAGMNNRHVSATQMNVESSRSHSIFTMTIESKHSKNGVQQLRKSRLNFVDLAGSERQKQTSSQGERLKEASNINKSLTVLGLVINTLVDNSLSNSKRHVPYRDSKLTFMLRDSLGGNSKTVMIASISPASVAFQETLSTLKFAQRAKLIRNQAVINEETGGSLDVLKAEIQRLKRDLSQMQHKNHNSIISIDLVQQFNDLFLQLKENKESCSVEIASKGQELLQALGNESIKPKRDQVTTRGTESMDKKQIAQLKECQNEYQLEKIKLAQGIEDLQEQNKLLLQENKQIKEEQEFLKQQYDSSVDSLKGQFQKIILQTNLSLSEFEQAKRQILSEKAQLIDENAKLTLVRNENQSNIYSLQSQLSEFKSQVFAIQSQKKQLAEQLLISQRQNEENSLIIVQHEQQSSLLFVRFFEFILKSQNNELNVVVNNIKQDLEGIIEKTEEEKLVLHDTIISMKEEIDTMQMAINFLEVELDHRQNKIELLEGNLTENQNQISENLQTIDFQGQNIQKLEEVFSQYKETTVNKIESMEVQERYYKKKILRLKKLIRRQARIWLNEKKLKNELLKKNLDFSELIIKCLDVFKQDKESEFDSTLDEPLNEKIQSLMETSREQMERIKESQIFISKLAKENNELSQQVGILKGLEEQLKGDLVKSETGNAEKLAQIGHLQKELEVCKLNQEAMEKFEELQEEFQRQRNKMKAFLDSYNLISVGQDNFVICQDKLNIKEKEILKLNNELQLERLKRQRIHQELDQLSEKEQKLNQEKCMLEEKNQQLILEKEDFFSGKQQQLKDDQKYLKLCNQIKHLNSSNQKLTEELNQQMKRARKQEEEKELLIKRMEEKLQFQTECNKVRKEVTLLQQLKDQNAVMIASQNQKQEQLLTKIERHFSSMDINKFFSEQVNIKLEENLEDKIVAYIQLLQGYEKELQLKILECKSEKQQTQIEKAGLDLLKEENKLLKGQLRKFQDAGVKQELKEEKFELPLRKKIKIIT